MTFSPASTSTPPEKLPSGSRCATRARATDEVASFAPAPAPEATRLARTPRHRLRREGARATRPQGPECSFVQPLVERAAQVAVDRREEAHHRADERPGDLSEIALGDARLVDLVDRFSDRWRSALFRASRPFSVADASRKKISKPFVTTRPYRTRTLSADSPGSGWKTKRDGAVKWPGNSATFGSRPSASRPGRCRCRHLQESVGSPNQDMQSSPSVLSITSLISRISSHCRAEPCSRCIRARRREELVERLVAARAR